MPLVRSRSSRSMTDTIATAQPRRHLERFRRRAHAGDACARTCNTQGIRGASSSAKLPRELKIIETGDVRKFSFSRRFVTMETRRMTLGKFCSKFSTSRKIEVIERSIRNSRLLLFLAVLSFLELRRRRTPDCDTRERSS